MMVYLLFVVALVRTGTASTPSPFACKREEQTPHFPQFKNTVDAWDKCRGHCKDLGDGWKHNGHWWHHDTLKRRSKCHCVKDCPTSECPVGHLAYEETKMCSINGYTCTMTDGPKCCNGRIEETRKCIPCDETRLRRDVHQVYKTAGSCEVYRCRRGLFDIVRMCEESGEWCDAVKADEENCLPCSSCLEEHRKANKCPECLEVLDDCGEFRTKRQCKKWKGDGCVWIGKERPEGRYGSQTCIHRESVPDMHCILLTDKTSCEKFEACGWIGDHRGGCIDFTAADCKYYKNSHKKCEAREECEFVQNARQNRGTCVASE